VPDLGRTPWDDYKHVPNLLVELVHSTLRLLGEWLSSQFGLQRTLNPDIRLPGITSDKCKAGAWGGPARRVGREPDVGAPTFVSRTRIVKYLPANIL